MQPAARYTLPVVFALAVAFGFGLSVLTDDRFNTFKIAFAVGFPLLTAGDLYRQALACQQYSYEFSDAINFAREKSAEGYDICLTGDDRDIPLENQNSLRYFFLRDAERYYRQPPSGMYSFLVKQGVPPGRCVLIARWSEPELLAAGIPGLTRPMIRRTYQIARGGYGVLESMSLRWNWVSGILGSLDRTTYDLGSTTVSPDSAFRLYLIDPSCAGGDCEQTGSRPGATIRHTIYGTAERSEKRISPDQEYSYTIRAGRGGKVEIPLGELQGAAAVSCEGQYRLTGGRAAFGVGDSQGRDVWNIVLEPDPKWRPLPVPPSRTYPAGKRYFLFFFFQGDSAAQLSLRSVKPAQAPSTVVIPPPRRFGALGW
jgi:hypothetical protein